MHAISITKQAAKDLEVLPKQTQSKIATAIDGLANEPRPPGCKKLRGATNAYRIRVGDYRLIYTVEDDRLTVAVLKIGHRKDIYG